MKALVIAPHPDDEILGCGGTMAKMADNGDEVYVCVVTEGKEPEYDADFVKNERQEMKNAHKVIGVKSTIELKMPAARLDQIPQVELNNLLTDVCSTIKPDVVYLPHIGDVHRDHKIVSQAAMVAVRPNGTDKVKRVLAYEVLSETDWDIPNVSNAFIPNVYEDIDGYSTKKIEAFMEYESQQKMYPSARSLKAIDAQMRYRGAIVGLKRAEAFMLIREILR